MRTLKIYYIDNDYIDYLRKFDQKVPYKKNKTRPFGGVVYRFHNHDYFAPLASPKPKHLIMNNNAIDIFKIDNGTLGIVNINNMIPVPFECLTELLPTISDEKYKNLLKKQLTFINDKKQELMSKVKVLYTRYEKNELSDKQKIRCCDFHLLEEKCEKYLKESIPV